MLTLIGDGSCGLAGCRGSTNLLLFAVAYGSVVILNLISASFALAREDAVTACKTGGMDNLVCISGLLMTKRLDNEIGKVEDGRAINGGVILITVDTGPIFLGALFGTGGSLAANVRCVVTELCNNGISLGNLVLMSAVGVILSAIGAVPVCNVTVLLASYGSACKPTDSGMLSRLCDKSVLNLELTERIGEVLIAIRAIPVLKITVSKARGCKSSLMLCIVTCGNNELVRGNDMSAFLVSKRASAALAVPELNVTVLGTGLLYRGNVLGSMSGVTESGSYYVIAYCTNLGTCLGSCAARNVRNLGAVLFAVTNLTLMPVRSSVGEPFLGVSVFAKSEQNVLGSSGIRASLVEEAALAACAIPILNVTLRNTGGSNSRDLCGSMYVNVKSARRALIAARIGSMCDNLFSYSAYGAGVIVSIGCLCPGFTIYVTLRNRLSVGLTAIGVVTDRGLSALDLARCVSVVNVFCETVTYGVSQFSLDFAAHLTGIGDCSLVFATRVNGNTLFPIVFAFVAAGRKPENAQNQNYDCNQREINFAEFLHSVFLSEILFYYYPIQAAAKCGNYHI